MASKVVLSSVFSLVLLCLILTGEASDCNSANACFGADGTSLKEIGSRKVLFGLMDKKSTLEGSLKGSSSSFFQNGGWELREVPSGPNPLHHNVPPKKPETL